MRRGSQVDKQDALSTFLSHWDFGGKRQQNAPASMTQAAEIAGSRLVSLPRRLEGQGEAPTGPNCM